MFCMRSSNLYAILVLAALATPGVACSNDHPPPATQAPVESASPSGLPDRDPALAHKLAASGGLVLDVRTTQEFSGKHVEGAVNIPVDDLESRMAEVEKLAAGDKTKPIVVYCQAGGRAAKAKKMLLKAGFAQVTNLGGVDDWDRK